MLIYNNGKKEEGYVLNARKPNLEILLEAYQKQ
jgi:hypothetical protein